MEEAKMSPIIDVGADLANAQIGFPVIPVGWYRAQIVGAPEKRMKAGGEFSYLAWEFSIVHEGVERHLFYNTTLKPSAIGMLKAVLLAANIPFAGSTFNTEDCLGRFLQVKVGVGEYEGRARNQVDDVKGEES